MREKLIELLWTYDQMRMMRMSIEECTDHLIANGVTIPVRCKDCEHWCYEYDDVGLCTTDVPDIDGVQRHADDFCSYGERKAE